MFMQKKTSSAGLKAALLAAGAAICTPFQANAQDDGAEDAEGDQIIVVGSRIARSAEDTGAQPVQFVSEAQFKATPAESVADFLRELPVNTGFSSSNFNNEYAGGNSSINLRGVGPQYTLVLVNGRRFGGEGTPDIGAIPPEAVDSVEILKTGGSSIYGSDGVAGVVNIKLKENFEGLDMVASYGGATQGGAGTFRVGAVGGFAWESLSLTGSIAYQDYNGFDRDDREFTASRDYRRFGGLDRRSGGIGDPNAFFIPSSGALLTLNPGSPGTAISDFVPFSTSGDLNRFSTNEVGVAPPVERINGHFALNIDILEDTLNFYTEGYIDDRQQDFFAQIPVNFGFAIPATNPFNPFGEDISGSYVFNEFGVINDQFDTTNVQVSTGFEGEVAGINFDIGYTRYSQTVDRTYTGDISPTLLAAAVSRTDATAFNPFCNNCNSPDAFDLSLTGLTNSRDEIETFDATFSGELFDFGAGPVAFAAGYQHRGVSFEILYNDVWENGGSNFSWFSEDFVDSAGERSVNAGFGELLVPLYANDNPDAILNGVEGTFSVRHENYSDFGGATVFSGLGRFDMFDGALILRGSYSESFRAPSVANLTLPQQTLLESGGFFFDPVRGGFFDVFVISGGNEDLGPEEGRTISGGIVFRPPQIDGLNITVDYFDLEITNLIRSPDGQALLDGTETAGTITRAADLTPTLDLRLDNNGDLNVAGVDFAISYSFETDGYGDFGVYANGVYQTKNERVVNDVTTELLGQFLDGQPRPELRSIFGVNWNLNSVDAAFNVDYSTGVDEILDTGTTVIDRTTDAWITVDMQVGYDFTEKFGDNAGGIANGLRAYVGVENLLDDGLPFVARSPDGWDRSIGDLRGRYVYGGVRKSF